MKYLDDDSQDKYHKQANSLLQVICSIFESYMYDYGLQVTIIDAEENMAVLGVTDVSDEVGTSVADTINHQFKRRDGAATCVYQPQTDGVFIIKVKHSHELNQLH